MVNVLKDRDKHLAATLSLFFPLPSSLENLRVSRSVPLVPPVLPPTPLADPGLMNQAVGRRG